MNKESSLEYLRHFIFIDEIYALVEKAVVSSGHKLYAPRNFHNQLDHVPETIELLPDYDECIYVFIRGYGDYDLRRTRAKADPIKVPKDVKRMLSVFIQGTHVKVKLWQTGNNDEIGYSLDRKINQKPAGAMTYGRSMDAVHKAEVHKRIKRFDLKDQGKRNERK